MGTGNVDQRTTVCTVDFQNVNADQIIGLVLLAGDLLGNAQNSILLLVALTNTDEDIAGGIDTQNGTGQQLLSLGRVGLVDHATLCLTDALDNDLLSGLSSDTAELLDVDGNCNGVTNLQVGIVLSCSVDVDLQSHVPQIVNDGLDLVHGQAFLGQADNDVFTGNITMIFTVLAVCIGESLLQTLHHIINGNALCLFQITQCGEDLCTNVYLRSFGLLLRAFSSHFYFSSYI